MTNQWIISNKALNNYSYIQFSPLSVTEPEITFASFSRGWIFRSSSEARTIRTAVVVSLYWLHASCFLWNQLGSYMRWNESNEDHFLPIYRCCSVSHICSSLYFPLLVLLYFYGKYNLTQRRAVFLRKPWRKFSPRRPSCCRGARPSPVRSW